MSGYDQEPSLDCAKVHVGNTEPVALTAPDCRRAASFFFLVATASQVSWDSRTEATASEECCLFAAHNEGSVSMDLQPLGDRLIVEVLEEEEMTISGIVLPDSAREKPQRGEVLAVGPGSRNDNGDVVPMDVEVGDEIIFSKYGGTEVKVGLEDLLILRESDVLAKAPASRPRRTSASWPASLPSRNHQERPGSNLRNDQEGTRYVS